MNKLEQAARQALEALESYSKSDYIKKQHPKRRTNGEKAITALREALDEQDTHATHVVRTKDLTDAEIAALVQRHTIDGKIMPFALCEAVIAADREKNK